MRASTGSILRPCTDWGTRRRSSAKRSRDAHSRPYVFTKCSLVWNDQREIGHSLKAASVRRELEASLRRLRVDVIDLYQIHWPDPEPEIEEGWQTLAQLQKEGKVRYIGVSNFNVEQMKRVERIAPITSLQPNYNIVTRDIEKEVLPFCREQHIGVIVYSPMKSGTADRQNDPRAHRVAAARRLSPENRQLQGTAAESQPWAGGGTPRDR